MYEKLRHGKNKAPFNDAENLALAVSKKKKRMVTARHIACRKLWSEKSILCSESRAQKEEKRSHFGGYKQRRESLRKATNR